MLHAVNCSCKFIDWSIMWHNWVSSISDTKYRHRWTDIRIQWCTHFILSLCFYTQLMVASYSLSWSEWFVTVFEIIQFSCTQQEDTLFTIKLWLYTLTNNSARYWWLSYPGCFYCGLLVRFVTHPQMLMWCSNGSISPWQAGSQLWFTILLTDELYLAWPWIKLLCVICGGENGTNGWHLAVQPYKSAGGISNISNKVSKMVGNMASYQSTK